jgi:hypothetical protein
MPSLQDSGQIRHELIRLLDLQLCALEKQVFGVMSDEEREQYEVRHDSINELYETLRETRTPAA